MKTFVAIALSLSLLIGTVLFVVLLRSARPVIVLSPVIAIPKPTSRGVVLPPVELATVGQERLDNSLSMKFRWCPPGVFTMEAHPASAAAAATKGKSR